MESNEIYPPANIALYNEENGFDKRSLNDKQVDPTRVDIFEYGPWQYPTEDPTVCARYVIGHSKQGYHWDTEFVIGKDEANIEYGIQKSCIQHDPSLVNWSPACAFVDQAIKHARRCIAIQAKNINLDTKTKIKLVLENGRETYMDIDQIPIDKSLVYRVEKQDLQRIALFNGYLSWNEFENGITDFNTA